MRSIQASAVLGLLLFVTACGSSVEVPPAHVGKLSTSSGLQDGIIQPSKFKLSNMCYNCDNLILAEASDYSAAEAMQVYMPKDQLNISVDVRGVFSISSHKRNIEKVFARVPADETKHSRVRVIPVQKVYRVYAQPTIRETARSLLTSYTIAQIMENRDEVSSELTKAVQERLASTPISMMRLGLADVQPPGVIVKAREAAKEREIAIQQAEANKQVALKEAEAALEVATKQQQVDLKEAETQVLVNQKLAEGVNDAFVTQRWLKVMDAMAKNKEGKVMILPFEAMKNPAMLMNAFIESQSK